MQRVARAVAIIAVVVGGFVAIGLGLGLGLAQPASAAASAPGPVAASSLHVTAGVDGVRDDGPCLRSANCAGGALLGGTAVALVAVLGAATVLAPNGMGLRLRAALDGVDTGRLDTGRHFRPPRLSV